MPRFFVLALLVLLLPIPSAVAAPWTVDDLVLIESASQWHLDPEGHRAVWVESSVIKIDGKEKSVSQLWMSRLDGDGKARQLTHGAGLASRPRFSPDGRAIAFLSERDLPPGGPKDKAGKTQIWLLPMDGGEARPLSRFARSVRAFGWIDAETLVVLAPEAPSAYDRAIEEKKDTTVVIEDAEHEPPRRLFRLTLAGEVKHLTDNEDWIDSLHVAPDGRHAVISASQSLSFNFDSKVPPFTDLVDLTTGERTRLYEGHAIQPGAITWKADSSGFFFTNLYSLHEIYKNAGVVELYEHDLERGRGEKVDLGWERGVGGAIAPVPGGVLVLLADGVRYRPAFYRQNGDSWDRQDLQGEHVRNIADLVTSRDGSRVLFTHSAVNVPEQIFSAELQETRLEAPRQLTKLNSRYDGKEKGEYEIFTWKGANGDEVEGLLHYPLDWQGGENEKKRPLVLDIHGGPFGADMDQWYQGWGAPNILWRQRGAFVFQVNYHGSRNYGRQWGESIAGHYYELEVPDIESGVDRLIERGLVDPEKMAATGWSNGGILTTALITHTRRYKAAVIGAADVEWISDWANVDFGASFDNYYFGSTPWEDPQAYIDVSPFFDLHLVTTPALVHTGDKDRNVPPHQSWEIYRVMQWVEKAPVRLLIYPGEPHSLREIMHRRRKIEEDLAWLDRYLFGKTDWPHESVKKGSRLATLLQRARAARDGNAFGERTKSVLVPETVPFGGLQVGRFELTRAQYAAFDGDDDLVPGEENLPITGLSFERAREYTAWLAETTGRPFRLPSVDEAKRLAKAAGHGGNTLDRWAGYKPNPDDAKRLTAALAALGDAAPLLLAVGQSPGKGDDPVFDLDGNAAEWALGDGGGVAFGASAERSGADHSKIEAALAYTGFRVVLSE